MSDAMIGRYRVVLSRKVSPQAAYCVEDHEGKGPAVICSAFSPIGLVIEFVEGVEEVGRQVDEHFLLGGNPEKQPHGILSALDDGGIRPTAQSE